MSKKQFLFMILCLSLPWVSYAQTICKYRYWFDKDDRNAVIGSFAGDKQHLDVDLGSLNDAMHTIYVQVKDTADNWSVPIVRKFVKMSKPNEIQSYYWLDKDETNRMLLAKPRGQMQIDVRQLPVGMHQLYIMSAAGIDNVSPVRTTQFLKLPVKEDVEYVYWFDKQHQTVNAGKLQNGIMMLDVNELDDGFHTIYLQATGTGGESSPTSCMFIKIPPTESIGEMTCICTIDGKLFKQEKVPSQGGIVNWVLDVSQVAQGVHRLQVQVVTPTGAASDVYNSFFFRIDKALEVANMKLVYNVDGGEFHTASKGYNGQAFHFDLDVKELTDGLHRINYMMMGDNGSYTSASSAFFVKTPVGGHGITKYEYWLNEDGERHSVALDKRVNLMSLVKLLPVETMPIRSSCFHFELKNGEPMMYAKNDFHITFYDASFRRVDETRQYVDYNVCQPVTDVTNLCSTQSFKASAANGIKWFSFRAEEGDSIALRSSQAISMQVLAPSGKEIYSASADRSVNYDGCHTWENGVYYVAVHDVTGTQPNVTLDYMHMDKYDVVDQNVKVVGNGGYNNITFIGNGFNELKSVVLDGSSHLVSDSIYHESDAKTSVRINFEEAKLGWYKATFIFKDGTKVVDNCIMVENAKNIIINGDVTFATTYLRSRTNTYTIQLTNNSNMTAYDIPLALFVYTPTLQDLKKVNLTGYNLCNYYRSKLPAKYIMQFNDSVNATKERSDDLLFFTKSTDNDYVTGFPALHKTIIPVTLHPNSTEVFKLDIQAETTAYVYVWYPGEYDMTRIPVMAKSNRNDNDVIKGLCAAINRRAVLCEEKEWAKEWGYDDGRYDIDCSNIKPNKNCPPPDGGSSTPVNSLDPNDIYGYVSVSGSKFMSDSIKKVNYRIEFENDTAFATASAHVVEIKDTLNSKMFDLASYTPTGIKIGDKSIFLDGNPDFVKTVDMRPSIDAIAQIEGKYDNQTGIATWLFTSLDPMTMEPTDNVMQGFLPVNNDRLSGIGEVSFDIKLKQPFADGTEISNNASIVFDKNEPISTPVWTNIVDAVSPESHITALEEADDSTVTVLFDGNDNRAGIWKYELYVQYGAGTDWVKTTECRADTNYVDLRVYKGMDYGFCVLAIDSAGNREYKDLHREASLGTAIKGDANSDGTVDFADVILIVNYYLEKPKTYLNVLAADVDEDGEVDITDAIATINIYLNDGLKIKSPSNAKVGEMLINSLE